LDFFHRLKYDCSTSLKGHPRVTFFAKTNINGWIKKLVSAQEQFNTDIHRNQEDEMKKYKLSDNYRKMVRKAATPRKLIQKQALITMIGHDITVSSFYNLVPFLNPESSRAGYLACDMLSRLRSWENNNYDEYTTDVFAEQFPYVDLIPWLEDSSRLVIDEGVNHSREYLNIIAPILTITFSRKVAYVVFSNFIHEHGLDSRTNLIDIVARPQIISFSTFELFSTFYF
jgi:hypothetical protein